MGNDSELSNRGQRPHVTGIVTRIQFAEGNVVPVRSQSPEGFDIAAFDFVVGEDYMQHLSFKVVRSEVEGFIHGPDHRGGAWVLLVLFDQR